jgi:hypothetical protein
MDELRTPMDDPSPGRTAYVGAVFIILFVLTVIALIAYFDRVRSQEFEIKVVDRPFDAVRDLRSQQVGKLEEYRWIDRGAGTVTIPIERAMELVVDERSPVAGGGS